MAPPKPEFVDSSPAVLLVNRHCLIVGFVATLFSTTSMPPPSAPAVLPEKTHCSMVGPPNPRL